MARVGGRGVNHPPLPRLAYAAVPAHHAHGCVRCGWRYEDNCADALKVTDGTCASCRSMDLGAPRRRAAWDESRRPRPCCITSSILITDSKLLVLYKLGGRSVWHICSECSRTHPFRPTQESF